MTDIEFNNQVAIITGAGRGLGESHARLLAARGARVVVNDLAGADKVAAEIRQLGGEATESNDDISSPEGAASLVGRDRDLWVCRHAYQQRRHRPLHDDE